MKRTIKKQFWFNREEAQDLQKKAKRACLSEAALVRLLIRGYEPRERPDDRFYQAMEQVSEMGKQVELLAVRMKAQGNVDAAALEKESKRWHRFQADIEQEFLRPGQKNLKWQ